jgi:hypothetical protein
MIRPWLATTGAICATNLAMPTAGNVVMVTGRSQGWLQERLMLGRPASAAAS